MGTRRNETGSLALRDNTTPTLNNLSSNLESTIAYSVLGALSFSSPSNLSIGGSDDISSSDNSSLVDWQAGSHLDPQIFPEESELGYGLEAAEHANVWHVYNEESTKTDAATQDSSNRGIDVLLVFTGLFSAVLTTFIIQSYQLMIPNPLDTTNALMSQYLSLQPGALAISLNSSRIPKITDATPTLIEVRWVNGLWFAALVCSLSAALFSMLAKQWLQATPDISGSPRHRARQRQRRYNQTQTWHVSTVINALPLLLHVALLLFFAGLIVLLWSGNLAITVITFTLVSLAYGLYFGSAWLSMVYPDCPYRHPLSDQLRCLMEQYRSLTMLGSSQEELDTVMQELTILWKEPEYHVHMQSNDFVDASCLVWLFDQCLNMTANEIGLQAIGGLPRNFTAFHVLRKAGAVTLILDEFRKCFHRDTTLDSQWYVLKAENAEKYCRAWIRLTYGTSQKWPQELIEPLDALRRTKGLGNVSAIAACTRAIAASPEGKDGRFLILSYLSHCAEGYVEFNHRMQCWLLDTFLQCSFLSRAQYRPKDHVAKKAVPILLRLLHNTKHTFASQVRGAIALSLSCMTGGAADLTVFNNEEKRREQFCELIIPALTNIVSDPPKYGVNDELLDMLAADFARLASLAFASNNISAPKMRVQNGNPLRSIAQQGLSRLYLDGRIKNLPSGVLADVHQILYPPVMLKGAEHALFVKALLQALWSSTDLRVMVGSVLRLLEPLLLAHPDITVVDTFIEGKGIAVLLRAAQTGDTDSRRLQLDCLRNVCLFVRTTAENCSLSSRDRINIDKEWERRLDHIFHSDFFAVLNKTVATRQWWLPEIAEIWVPALVKLCELRPCEAIWKQVELTFRRFAESNEGRDGWMDSLFGDLDKMNSLIYPAFG